ncbi:MAG: ATP synthase F1 subunit delta [Polyangia bacterium]
MAALAGSIARRYARALFAIGVDKRSFEALGSELEALAALWNEATEMRQSLSNPIFRSTQKRAILQGLLPQVAPTREVQSLAFLLLERGRIAALPAIARAYQEMCDDKLGRARATVKSARPLDVATQTEIRQVLERRTGRSVIMTTEVDPSLMGGIVAQVAGLVLDGSLRARLHALSSKILN